MALATRNLSVLSYAQGFTLWHYKAGADPIEDIVAPGFFRDAADLLSPGDLMMISSPHAGRVMLVTHTENQPALCPLG